MFIRKATSADHGEIMEIYAYARRFMAEHGNPRQWAAKGWPPADLILRDIAAGKCHLCMDGDKIAAVFYYEAGEDIDPTYRRIEDGAWLQDGPYGVVHRIAVAEGCRGAGSFCLNWAYQQCGHLRIDTHGDNTVMQNTLKKLGFSQRGIIYVAQDNDPRIAFEKI